MTTHSQYPSAFSTSPHPGLTWVPQTSGSGGASLPSPHPSPAPRCGSNVTQRDMHHHLGQGAPAWLTLPLWRLQDTVWSGSSVGEHWTTSLSPFSVRRAASTEGQGNYRPLQGPVSPASPQAVRMLVPGAWLPCCRTERGSEQRPGYRATTLPPPAILPVTWHPPLPACWGPGAHPSPAAARSSPPQWAQRLGLGRRALPWLRRALSAALPSAGNAPR